MSQNKKETVLTGNTMEFVTPSKLRIVIREQNGEDEDIISKAKNLKDGNAIHYFLAGIIQSVDGLKIGSS